MSVEIRKESIDTLVDYYNAPNRGLNWPVLFVTPLWLQAWWDTFGKGYRLFLRSIWENSRLIGLAPLMLKGGSARLLGSKDVCDYLDFITLPDREDRFFEILISELKKNGLEQLELEALRPEAAVFGGLFAEPAVHNPGCTANFVREDETFELPLPPNWEDYLSGLKKKQRHEVRRKLRRLENEVEAYRYTAIDEYRAVQDFFPQFLELFKQHPEKAAFLTPQAEDFFRLLVDAAARAGIARFGLLEVDNTVAAAVLYFDHRGRIHLYNSGFNPVYADLSAGLLCKLFCLKESIEKGKETFDFLKGREVYKSRLGGSSVPVYSARIKMN